MWVRVSVCVKNLKINKGSFPSLYQAPKNCKKYQGAKYMVRNNNKKAKLKGRYNNPFRANPAGIYLLKVN